MDTPFFLRLHNSLCREVDRSLKLDAGPKIIGALVAIRAAVRNRNIETALREVDRAWRLLSGDSIFAPIYARVLCLDAKDPQAALALLRCAVGFSPDPEIAALIATSLLQLRRFDEARSEFEAALSHYCVNDDSLLAHAGDRMTRHPAIRAAGWIGLDDRLKVVARLAAPYGPSGLDIAVDGDPAFSRHMRLDNGSWGRVFDLDLPPGIGGRRLMVSSRGVALLGDGSLGARGFSVDGRARNRGRRLYGWARIGWAPDLPIKLRIEDSSGRLIERSTGSRAHPSWHWPFGVDLDKSELRGNEFRISAQLPDGNWQPLPDAPLLLKLAPLPAARKPPPLRGWRSVTPVSGSLSSVRRARLIDVIIPSSAVARRRWRVYAVSWTR